jgi:hypothetical protein
MPIIDVHTHFLSPELADKARAGQAPDGLRTGFSDGQEWVVHRQGFRYPLHVSLNAGDRTAIAGGNAALPFGVGR